MNKIAEYYKSKYGSPAREAIFVSPGGQKIEIFKWDGNQTEEGVTMYATVGASTWLGDNKTGCEFFIGLTPAVDDVAQAVAETAVAGNGTREVPLSGDTITLTYPLWSGTAARTFMFTDGEEIFSPLRAEGKTIFFIQLVPLFDAEVKFKKKNGEAELWELFERHLVPYWDSTRVKCPEI